MLMEEIYQRADLISWTGKYEIQAYGTGSLEKSGPDGDFRSKYTMCKLNSIPGILNCHDLITHTTFL